MVGKNHDLKKNFKKSDFFYLNQIFKFFFVQASNTSLQGDYK